MMKEEYSEPSVEIIHLEVDVFTEEYASGDPNPVNGIVGGSWPING